MSWATMVKGGLKIVSGGSGYLYAGLVAAGVALTGAAVWWHWNQVDDAHEAAFKEGQAEVQARWDTAKAQAEAAQQAQTDAASVELDQEVKAINTVFKDRIKEVKVYVPSPVFSCPADAEFVRLFNGAAAR